MKCIRCGRAAADGETFCAECRRIVEVPLEESPYLSTRIQIPVRPSAAPAAKTEKRPKQEEKPAKKGKKHSRGGLIAAVVLLSILCLGLTALCAKNFYDEYFTTDAAKGQQILLQDENTRLLAAKERLQNELTEAEQTAAQLRENISDLNARIVSLEQELDGSRVNGSQTDLTLREAEQKLSELTAQVATLTEQLSQCETKISSLQTELDNAQTKLDALTSENSALRTELSALRSDMNFLNSRIAFINTDSKTYHTYDCSYFTTSKSWIAYNVSNAKQNGYTPCPHCH